MAKKKSWTPKEEAEINRIRQTTGATRKTAIRKMRAAAKAKPKVKTQRTTKTKTPPQSLPKSVVSLNRSEGIRLFKLAGRPTKEQFILVYGERGPRMTWDERPRRAYQQSSFRLHLLLSWPRMPSRVPQRLNQPVPPSKPRRCLSRELSRVGDQVRARSDRRHTRCFGSIQGIG